MSLATRCTACGTVFRVVQDQLKVSEGWVRCGRCSEVFNALEGLFDLERDAPPDWSPALSQPSSTTAKEGSSTLVEVAVTPSDPSLPDRIDSQLLSSHRKADSSPRGPKLGERNRPEFPDARFGSVMPTGDAADDEPEFAQGSPFDFGPATAASAAAPEFMRQAQRDARQRRPMMRVLLSVLTLMLLTVLVLQGVHHFRDLIAARWTTLKPALTAWCGVASCSIESPRRIEDVSVESSALARASVADAFKLSVTLRNRSTMTVVMPSVDLSLTDPTGQLVARRVLTPRDFRAESTLMQSGADAALQLVLATGSTQVTGYTVEIFYP